jgi:hypothetical protein
MNNKLKKLKIIQVCQKGLKICQVIDFVLCAADVFGRIQKSSSRYPKVLSDLVLN